MKKISVIFLIVIYLIPMSGILLQFHYCGGNYYSMKFSFATTSQSCACGSTTMKKKGSELEFISQILKDGSRTEKLKDDYVAMMDDDVFSLTCLSLTYETYIASGLNSFVVKIKTQK